MEYIEREKAIDEIDKWLDSVGYVTVGKGLTSYGELIGCLEDTPTADVAEVVRCNDCVYCCISTDPKTNISIQKCGYVGFNPVQSSQVSDDFYCGYGERKDGE